MGMPVDGEPDPPLHTHESRLGIGSDKDRGLSLLPRPPVRSAPPVGREYEDVAGAQVGRLGPRIIELAPQASLYHHDQIHNALREPARVHLLVLLPDPDQFQAFPSEQPTDAAIGRCRRFDGLPRERSKDSRGFCVWRHGSNAATPQIRAPGDSSRTVACVSHHETYLTIAPREPTRAGPVPEQQARVRCGSVLSTPPRVLP
jgi:hypothetical protein